MEGRQLSQEEARKYKWFGSISFGSVAFALSLLRLYRSVLYTLLALSSLTGRVSVSVSRRTILNAFLLRGRQLHCLPWYPELGTQLLVFFVRSGERTRDEMPKCEKVSPSRFPCALAKIGLLLLSESIDEQSVECLSLSVRTDNVFSNFVWPKPIIA